MKNHIKSLVLVTLITTSISYTYSQGNLLWNHKSILNPGATALENDLLVSGTGSFFGHSNWGTTLSADFKLNKWNSGIGISFQNSTIDKFMGVYSPKFRYAYHLKLGKETVLGLGTSIGVNVIRQNYNPTYNQSTTSFSNALGANLKWRNFNFGWTTTMAYGSGYSTGRFYHLLSAEYLWKVNDNWKLDFSIMSNLRSWEPDGGIRAIYKDKFGFGVYKMGNQLGLDLRYKFNENWSVGYSFSTFKKLSNISHNNHYHNVNLQFTLPHWKAKKKSVGL